MGSLIPSVVGSSMVFCTSCGRELSEDAYFCPKCGAVTQAGRKAGVASPLEDMRQTLWKMGEELGRVLRTTARQTQSALAKTSEEIRHRVESTSRCANCGNMNPFGSRFCSSCGKTLTTNSAAKPRISVEQRAEPGERKSSSAKKQRQSRV